MPTEEAAVLRNRAHAAAEGTRAGQRKGWARWLEWARARGVPVLPANPEDLERFAVAHLAGECKLRWNTVRHVMWAINAMHRDAGMDIPGEHPVVRLALRGLVRQLGAAGRQQRPLTIAEIARMQFPATLRGARDKALLLVGFAGALRRGELAALDVEQIEPHPAGILLYLPRSKTDQEGAGARVFIGRSARFSQCCPVGALEGWLAAAGHATGPLFRGVVNGRPRKRLAGADIDRIIKECTAAAGLGPGYGGHSLRAGCATWLAENGVHPAMIARHGRWRKLDMVLTYVRGETAAALRGIY